MKFCTKTKGLTEEENSQFAKNLKKFTKNEMKKLQSEESEQEPQMEESSEE